MDPTLIFLQTGKAYDLRSIAFVNTIETTETKTNSTVDKIYSIPKVKSSLFEDSAIELANIDNVLNFTGYWGGLYYNNSTIKNYFIDLSPKTFGCLHYLQYRCLNSFMVTDNINNLPDYLEKQRVYNYMLPKENMVMEAIKYMPFTYQAIVGCDVNFEYALKVNDFVISNNLHNKDLPIILTQTELPSIKQLEQLASRYQSVNFFKLASTGRYCLYAEVPSKINVNQTTLKNWYNQRLAELMAFKSGKLALWKCPKIWHLPTTKSLF